MTAILAACGGDSHRPTENSEALVALRFELRPAFRFCPETPCVFTAEISIDHRGTYTLTATGLREGDPANDDCHEYSSLARTCIVEVPLPDHVLSSAEALRLELLLADMPRTTCPIDGAVDPCVDKSFELPSRTLHGGPCQAGNEDYLNKLENMTIFLNELTGLNN
jgi:hypothetical protein